MKTENLNHEEIEQQRQDERTRWGDPAKVRFLDNFADGGLKAAFEEIGQDFHVHTGDIRVLPAALLDRVIQSGAKVEPVL